MAEMNTSSYSCLLVAIPKPTGPYLTNESRVLAVLSNQRPVSVPGHVPGPIAAGVELLPDEVVLHGLPHDVLGDNSVLHLGQPGARSI